MILDFFEQPAWFYLLPTIGIVIYLLDKFKIIKKYQHAAASVSIYLPVLQKFNTNSSHTGSRNSLFLWLCILLITCSLAQPVSRTKIPASPDNIKDIIFLVDVSVGMSIKDYQLQEISLDRLTLLKAVLSDFVSNLTGSRIGVLVYADKAFTLIPLSRDRQLLQQSITRIQPAIAGRQNNLSNALTTVLREFDFTATIPTVVVLSQGANLDGNISPLLIAQQFIEKKIKLHFIGLGSDSSASDTSVKLIFDPIDHKLLQTMASVTGGEFFWAGKSESLNSILSIIKKAETIQLAKSEQYLITNHFRWPLYLLLALVFGRQTLGLFRGQMK